MRIASVIRMGLPPYDENSEKLYRLEGAGCGELRKGDELPLSRPNATHLRLGKLKIILVRQDHALARLLSPGDTYPMKGDLALRPGELKPLPEPAKPEATSILSLAELAPKKLTPSLAAPQVAQTPKAVQSPNPLQSPWPSNGEGRSTTKIDVAPVPLPLPVSSSAVMPVTSSALVAAQPLAEPSAVIRREVNRGAILFRKGSAHLTPGAVKKLALWYGEWGREGTWVLLRPANDLPSQINTMRFESIRDELVKLGVEQVELRDIPAQAAAKYDSVYIVLER